MRLCDEWRPTKQMSFRNATKTFSPRKKQRKKNELISTKRAECEFEEKEIQRLQLCVSVKLRDIEFHVNGCALANDTSEQKL